jgi:hypothetical protein
MQLKLLRRTLRQGMHSFFGRFFGFLNGARRLRRSTFASGPRLSTLGRSWEDAMTAVSQVSQWPTAHDGAPPKLGAKAKDRNPSHERVGTE